MKELFYSMGRNVYWKLMLPKLVRKSPDLRRSGQISYYRFGMRTCEARRDKLLGRFPYVEGQVTGARKVL
jgi:hypothetical protein